MSYEIGTHIDLTYLNKRGSAAEPKKKTFEAAIETLVEVGTSYTFTPELKTVLHIPVVYA